MKKRIFAVCDPNKEYCVGLTQFLNRQSEFPFQAIPFTQLQLLYDFAGKRAVDVALVAESLLDQPMQQEGIGKIMVLTEEIGKDPKQKYAYAMKSENIISGTVSGNTSYVAEAAGAHVYRYQACAHIMRRIMTEIVPPLSEREDVKNKASIIGVYSPLGRCGKTSFAVTLGAILAQKEKTLYLNMESCSAFPMLLPDSGGGNLSDMIYRARMRSGMYALQASLAEDNHQEAGSTDIIGSWGNLDYIPPAPAGCDVHDISYEEWEALLQDLVGGYRYEAIVLDVGEQTEELVKVLEMCSVIYMPVLDDTISQAKLKRFDLLLELLGKKELRDVIRMIHVPKVRMDSVFTDFPSTLVRGKIGSYVRHMLIGEA